MYDQFVKQLWISVVFFEQKCVHFILMCTLAREPDTHARFPYTRARCTGGGCIMRNRFLFRSSKEPKVIRS